ncbi:heterokaryon incompatibility protein-domain-containing protein [Leptodontidium sp. MPI-SDFR-AT-0119]|nr:heterokaryon incompatibility protein-domain-containing protein [Leptodontidium sp. MPI-SDFR-AT-0119]
MSAGKAYKEKSNWKQRLHSLAGREKPKTQPAEDLWVIDLNPYRRPYGDYCLVQAGFLSTSTLLYYRKPLHMVCCQSCQLIYNAIEAVKPGWRDVNLEKKSIRLTREEIRTDSVPASSWTVFEVRLLEDGDVRYIQLAQPNDESLWEAEPNPIYSLGSLATALTAVRTAVANRWLDACVQRHRICRVPDSTFIPRRLIEVGNDSRDPRLVEELCATSVLRPRYAALSYCWGPEQNTFRTTRDNIESNKQTIAFTLLPQTIQDAIRVCRALKIDYLWVDALCIIQGDEGVKDWYEQSGQMRKIYSNSYLTIAAEDCPGSIWGFWKINPKKWEQLSVRRGRNNNSMNAWVENDRVPTRTDYGILSTRGWALQEGILPNRILHFTCFGMEWECCQCSRNESEFRRAGFDMMKLTFRAFRVIKLGRDVRAAPPEGFGELDPCHEEIHSTHITDWLTTYTPKAVYYAWDTIIECYSGRNLTNHSDRLTAVSGLAGIVIEYLGLQSTAYLAGLWLDDLAEGLLWYVKPGYKSPQRSLSFVAPSWSWASIDGPVEYFRERYQFRFEPDIQVLDAKCKRIPEDPTGRVANGYISLEGPLVPVSLQAVLVSKTTPLKSAYNGRNGSASKAHFKQVTHVQSLLADKSEIYKVRKYEVLCDEDVWAHPLPEGTNYYCLRVGETIDSITGGKRYWWLVLRKVESESEVDQTVYQRVGLGYFQALERSFYLFDGAPLTRLKLI